MDDSLARIKTSSEFEHWGTGCIILNKENKILCIERSDNHEWSSPGGTVDPGETVVDAVIREIKEEVGLEIVNPKYLGMCYNRTEKNGQAIIWNAFSFVCDTYSGEVTIQPDEISQYKWLSLNELSQYELFKPFAYSLQMLLLVPEYNARLHNQEVAKMTSIEQMTSIHNNGSNGGKGHYDVNGKWVYDRADKKPAPQPEVPITGVNRANPNQIAELRDSYIRYFNNVKDVKAVYTVKNGKFTFPSLSEAIQQGIAKNEQDYFKKFKEQYILYVVSGK